MMKILQGLLAEQGRIKSDAAQHQQDDRASFGTVTSTLEEIKDGQTQLHGQVKALTDAVAKIAPTVDELKADKIRAQERAAVLRELAQEKAQGDAVADKADERRSRWITPLLAAAVPVILALALGWANDHFHHHGTEAKASTTVTTTVDRPR